MGRPVRVRPGPRRTATSSSGCGLAHATASGQRPQEVWAAPYGSDLRLLIGQGGIPTMQYGPGDVALAHGPDELVPVEDMTITARALALMALDICKIAT